MCSCSVQIDFHDTGRGGRVPAMTDHFGFTMASLNENGSVFANPCKGDKNMSTLMYRPFKSWANNSEVCSFFFLIKTMTYSLKVLNFLVFVTLCTYLVVYAT